MSLVKIPLVGISTLVLHVAATPPHQPMDTEVVNQTAYERFFNFWAKTATRACFAGVYWLGVAIEIMSILARKIDPRFIPHALESTVEALNTLKEAPISPAFLIGSALVTFGGLLRMQCYRTLGRYFTFIISLRKEHRLVTSGPYAVVRHPSYTGATLCIVGALLINGTKDSFLRSSGIMRIPGVRPLALAWAMGVVAVNVVLLRRIRAEDEMLKAAFGEEWERWAKRVKYMLIPGIY